MADSYELTQLDANSFEHMVNFLALKVLGKGVTGFSAGADGGRDGYISGEAPYPTESERWSGTWYIQSKFHKPHLSKNPQAWLTNEVKKELEEFQDSEARITPNIWIIATNIEPSGFPQTGAYDSIQTLVKDAFGDEVKFDIWGGRRILDFLALNPTVASYYGHFLTPGNVLTALYDQINDSSAQIKPIINHLILDQFSDQIYTKLEQAGSSGVRPKIHELFVDLPAEAQEYDDEFFILETLVATSANVHTPTVANSFGDGWREWSKFPRRARVLLLKGGPGQGKSTAGQFYAQIQRASLLLEPDAPTTLPGNLEIARELLIVADEHGFKPITPRIPISIELKDFATWYGTRSQNESRGIISYLCDRISQKLDQKVEGGTLKRALSIRSWFLNFDGLDEVPNDVKDSVANEIIRLTNTILPELNADILVLCTTRPQGYSGQFQDLDAVTLELCSLPDEVSMKCAAGVIKFGHTESESKSATEVLASAMESPQVRALMTTPLQSHIMAVVVRDGGRPPEKRWELFENFYQVMKKRETLKNFPDARINKLLRGNGILLKAIHARLGISLHASAEISRGAETTLERDQFCTLARQTTERYVEENVEDLVETLMEATTERLVFVNTPESSNTVRFDIRQLQEFFAGEFIYSNVDPIQLRSRLEVIGRDSHWREVMHFAISALIVTMRPTELAVALEVICKLDDSDHSHPVRTFRRRTGIGAILTLRLLNEGVLEEDRAVRLKFKEALTPLYAMLDSGVTSAIISLKQPHTLSWLLGCMIDALFEYSEPEQIGAAIVLCRKLPDHHQRANEVAEKIFSSSVKYINAIYKSFYRDHQAMFGTQNALIENDWFINKTIGLLLAENPDPDLDINGILRLLRRHNKARTILNTVKLPPVERQLLLILIDTNEQTKKHKQITYKIDEITVAEYECNWKTKTEFPGIDIEVAPSEVNSPILRILAHIINFHNHQRLEDLCSALTLMIEHKLDNINFPSPIEALLPIDFDSKTLDRQLSYFKSFSDIEFRIILDNGGSDDYKLPSHYELIDFGTIDSLAKLKIVAGTHPIYAITMWLQNYSYAIVHDKIEPRSEEIDSFILDLIIKNTRSMHFFFGSWGMIFDRFPTQEKKLRALFLADMSAGNASSQVINLLPFRLNIPSELPFLMLLAKALIPDARLRGQHDFSNEKHPQRKIIESYGLDNITLKEIFNLEDNSSLHRAAALCCYLSQIEDVGCDISKDIFSTNLSQTLLSLCDEVSAPWFLTSISYILRTLDNNSIEAMELVGKILHAYRSNYEARATLQELLADWRERSEAPVNRHNLLADWLKA